MLKIKNTLPEIFSCYTDGAFDLEKWESYIDGFLPGYANFFISDMQELCDSGDYTFENDVCPILNAVAAEPLLRKQAEDAFLSVTEGLNARIEEKFGRVPDAEIYLYLGLCNGAGWVTDIDGKHCILLGIEKIMELSWTDRNSMNGLILHELGHMYHQAFGIFNVPTDGPDRFLWQLFTEGIAQFFESTLVEDPDYFHQDKDGWRLWCDLYLGIIKADFNEDLPMMTRENQCYFGDWVDYCGKPDVGYYLGARFVQWIAELKSMDEMIRFTIDDVRAAWEKYLEE